MGLLSLWMSCMPLLRLQDASSGQAVDQIQMQGLLPRMLTVLRGSEDRFYA